MTKLVIYLVIYLPNMISFGHVTKTFSHVTKFFSQLVIYLPNSTSYCMEDILYLQRIVWK